MIKFITLFFLFIASTMANNNFIQVKGSGISPTKPDFVSIQFSMITVDKLSKVAQSQNTKVVKKVISGLKKGFNIKDSNIQTMNYSMRPKYSYPRNSKPIFEGMEVENRLKVTLPKVSKTGELLDFLTKKGITNISQITFGASNESHLRKEALKLAYDDALQKAKVLAKRAGVSLGKAVQIKESIQRNIAPHMEMMSKSLNSAPPIEGGSISITASLIVDFEIAQ